MTYHIISRRGDREINEDYAGVKEDGGGFCCVLADGLGGHEKGEEASRIVVETALALFDGGDVNGYLERCFVHSQEALLKAQKSKRAMGDMKTTMTVLAACGETIRWGHVGDSRLYYFKDSRLRSRTLDHSVPQMLAACGEIKEKEIRFHEDRNRLLRVMGSEWTAEAPAYELAPAVGKEKAQAFLLCSDGFWELVDERQMTNCLRRSENVEDWLLRMEAKVLRQGEGKDMDNYTAIGVFVDDGKRKKRFLF